ncbi:hypothetical protein T01_10203 [Trichinella spiralis]|uniref:DAN domain-containing protein n=2 Tax=Trichinella spiralis TaxID=6334 RepID=A0A0V1AUL9_TRISP|nr:hypothetical protein T01_10203 [Trichinella spiralis]
MCSSSSKLAWTKSAGGDSSNNLNIFQQDCRIVAVEKLITIPGCIPVRVQLNACRGYCLSWTVPDGRRTVASYAMCCRMVERELVEFETRCQESKREKFSFTSAVSCECFDSEEEKWKFDDSLIDGGWFTMMALRKRFKNQSGFHKRPLENLPATDTHYRHSGVEEFVAVVVMSMRHAYHHKQVRNREPGYLWVTVCLFHCIVSGPVWSGPVRVMQMLSGR